MEGDHERRNHKHLGKLNIKAILGKQHLPMCDGQSTGLGTKAGDQQYVKGISRASANEGPTAVGTGSRSIVFLHLLITSPRLNITSTETA